MVLKPFDGDVLHELAHTFKFEEVPHSGEPSYRLFLPNEQAIKIFKGRDGVEVNLYPRIYSPEQHEGKSLMFSLYLMLADLYAKEVQGTAYQTNIRGAGCSGLYEVETVYNTINLVVAKYPELPMTHEMLCSSLKAIREQANEASIL